LNASPDALSVDFLHQQFCSIVQTATRDQQLALLKAHPELASAPASQSPLTPDSLKEQKGAGLDQCSESEFREFERLNRHYLQRFGFPFIMAVSGFGRQEILAEFRQRIENDFDQEFARAIEQVCKIARIRLQALMAAHLPGTGRHYRNLAEPQLGGAVLQVSDDFFAAAKRMLAVQEPVFHADLFDEHGKWMDGWESRRKRTAGHDFCVIRICPGVIYGVDIDTTHFTGNFAPAASLEACSIDGDPDEDTQWTELIPVGELQSDRHHYLRVGDRNSWNHLRLNIFPDGGIARLRVFGEALDRNAIANIGHWRDLACSDCGGEALACNDMHYGDMANLIKPGDAANMGDGWETRRRRHPGNDWVVLKLGQAGVIRRIVVDTAFFKGNNPGRCTLRGISGADSGQDLEDSAEWPLILPMVALGPDQMQVFQRELTNAGPVTHVRFDIFPDGGVARLRLEGEPVEDS